VNTLTIGVAGPSTIAIGLSATAIYAKPVGSAIGIVLAGLATRRWWWRGLAGYMITTVALAMATGSIRASEGTIVAHPGIDWGERIIISI